MRQSASNALLVCTAGVLLRRLEAEPDLSSCDVVLLDEVHERSVEHDLLLLALRRILSRQEQRSARTGRGPRRRARLRVGLMSATVDAAMLSGYFATSLRTPVAHVAVDGRSYPVETRHLEDALAETRHAVRPAAPWCLHSEVARRRFAEEGLLPPPLLRRAALRERFPDASDEVLDA